MTDAIFLVVGGLGLFLYGMRIMSDGLKRAAGDRMRSILRAVTRNVPMAVLVGCAVTCLVQSSSATTVMVVGFANAGLMTLKQAIGVIMGANIGTTVTAWLVSMIGLLKVLKITNYALPAIGIGFGLNLLGKRDWKHVGSVVLGFGLLFLGLSFLKDAFDPVGESERARQIIATMARNPVMGVLIGTAMTMLIQSSSATIAIVQLLAFSGAISYVQTIPVILGDNIGTTITAQIAGVGTSINARRAARAHLVFNLLGVCIMLPFYKQLGALVQAIFPAPLAADNVMAHIALTHSIFNVTNTLIFMPMTGVLATIVKKVVPGEPDVVQVEPQYLEEHLLDTPPIALEQARREVVRMIELAAGAVQNASRAFFNNDRSEADLARRKEEAIDNLQNKITQYLIQVSRRHMEPQQSNELPVLLHSVNDIERIGDHAQNLAEAAQRKIEDKLVFTEAALEELSAMRDEVMRMFDTVVSALASSDAERARAAFESEDKLNAMEKEFRESHLTRLANGDCNFYSGLTFVDCIYNYEKIGDHLVNTAQAVLGDFQWGEKVRGGAAARDATEAPVPGET